MSYLIYINELQIENYYQSFALSKQNNDIADISNRNADYSQNIKIPRTAKNTKILETAGLIGRNSNVPYQKNTAQIIDADTGVHLVVNGWAVLLNTDTKDYNLSIYSGNINFFKAIENITLTDCGLDALNHIKNLANVKATWTNTTLPYRYLIADYNGKIYHSSKINIDYQIPSASIKYLWNRVFNFIGFEFEGAIFNNEEFKDLWLSYPKPVPTTAPDLTLVTNQDSVISSNFVQQPSGEYITYQGMLLLPNLINTAQIVPTNKFAQAGSYLFKVSGSASSSGTDANGLPFTTTYKSKIKIWDNLGNIFLNETEINNEIIVTVGIDYRFALFTGAFGILSNAGVVNLQGGFNTEISKINGYNLGFDKAFIDFKVSDFIKEIMMRFSLTPFAIPNTNKVKFLTLDEIFQDTNLQDWSDKFHGVTNESYTLSKYGQNNLLKFKYNDTNANHNDSKLIVKNENIKEEITLFASRFFSPDKKTSTEISGGNVYPIWSKNIKDNNLIEYKELDNRFYLLRSELKNTQIDISSEFLGGQTDSSFYYKENYYRCKWLELINVWYKNINKLLDFTKIITANIYLKPFEYSQLQMERMVFINQLGSYFLINKISNFTPQKATKVELIKVEYFSEPIEILPTDPFVEIVSYVISNCNITFTINHNLEAGQILYLKLFSLSTFNYIEYQTITAVQGTIVNNEVTFSLSQFNIQTLVTGVFAKINGFTSVFTPFESSFINVTTNYPLTCYVPAGLPNDLTLLNVVYLGIQGNNVNGIIINIHTYSIFYNFTILEPNQTNYVLTTEVYVYNNSGTGLAIGWNITQQVVKNITDLKESIINLNISLQPSNINKFRVKINNSTSNEINI